MAEALRWDHDGRDWPHREASRFVDTPTLRWHVQSLGRGPALLLLHGTGASSHTWRALLPSLARRFRVVAPDLPGHAFSGALPPSQRSLAGMARALDELMQTLDLQPLGVLGHSAGAALMLRMALDGCLGARLLVGLNPALMPFGGWTGTLFPSMARWLAVNPLVPRLAAWRARDPTAVRRLIESTGSTLDDEGVEWYGRLLRSPGHVAGVLSMVSHWDLHGLQRELPSLDHDVHLLVGTRDSTVPPRQAEQLAARMPRIHLQRLPGLGHLAHEEAPLDVVERVLALAGPFP